MPSCQPCSVCALSQALHLPAAMLPHSASPASAVSGCIIALMEPLTADYWRRAVVQHSRRRKPGYDLVIGCSRPKQSLCSTGPVC